MHEAICPSNANRRRGGGGFGGNVDGSAGVVVGDNNSAAGNNVRNAIAGQIREKASAFANAFLCLEYGFANGNRDPFDLLFGAFSLFVISRSLGSAIAASHQHQSKLLPISYF